MLSTTLLLTLLSQSAPECRTSGLNQACGYSCRAELDQVKCAQTPEGFCTRLEQQLVCWDPPEEVRLHPYAEGVAMSRGSMRDVAHDRSKYTATCHAKYREVACGFACVTSPNHLACAQTPYGVCATRFDEVTCWDPAPATLHHFTPAELAGAKCVQSDTGFACGWDCKKSYQQVQCAQTPKGRCAVNEGRLTCFDPPLPSITHAPPPPTK